MTVAFSPPADAPPAPTIEEIDASAALREIRKNCFLLSVTVRRWDGKYMIPGASAHLESVELKDDLVTKARWKLMPDEWHKQIQPFVSQTRSAIYQVGTPFKEGVYIVPKSKAQELVRRIESIRVDYRRLVDQFVAAWPGILRGLKEKISRDVGDMQWETLAQKIPPQDELAGLFDIEIALWPIGGGGQGMPPTVLDCLDQIKQMLPGARMAAGDLPVLPSKLDMTNFLSQVERLLANAEDGANKILGENLDSWMQEAAETTNRLVGKAVENMLTGPIQDFADAVKNLEDLQQREGVCRSGTIDAIRRAHSKLIGFKFMVPPVLVARLKQVEVRLGEIAPRDVNTQSNLARQLTKALQDISTDLKSDEARARGMGQFTRNLDL